MTYRMKKDFRGIKEGTIFRIKEELGKFVNGIFDGKEVLVPLTCCEKYSTEDEHVDDEMSVSEAKKLMKELGIGTKLKDKAATPKVKEEKKEKPKPKPKKVKLKKGEFLLSSITGGRLPTSGVDHIMSVVPKGTFTKEQQVDIPKVDPMYVWSPDLLEEMWMAWKHNKKMLLSGLPGTGKTTGAEQFCAIIQHPRVCFDGKDGVEPSSFLGYAWAKKGGMEWRDGVLPQGVRDGYVVIINEVFKIPPGCMMAMQKLWEENGYLILDEKPGTPEEKNVYPHEMFRMIVTDNVKGTGDQFDKFAATQVQDSSSLDRFGITAHVEYMNKKDEVGMLMRKYPKRDKSEVESLVKFAGLIRNGYAKSEISITLSPRGLQTVCELLDDIPDIQTCIRMAYTNKLGDDDEVDAVKQMIQTVWR